jgi:predicted nucleic acid-binding protein
LDRLSAFVDTSVWVAAVDEGDPRNERARSLLSGLDEPLMTSDHVLIESWLLVARRIHRVAADRFWDAIRLGAAALEMVTPADLDTAWTIREAFPDQRFSLVDLTSFALMQRLGVHRVASFDSDFAVFRFGPRRERAFTVLT